MAPTTAAGAQGLLEQQGALSPRLWRQLQRTGNAPERMSLKKSLKEFVRTELFARAKFLVKSDLGAYGRVSNKVRKHFNGKFNKKEWEIEWEEWAKKETKSTINERRNTLAQAIMNSVTKGKSIAIA